MRLAATTGAQFANLERDATMARHLNLPIKRQLAVLSTVCGAILAWVSCGVDTDADRDGFYNTETLVGMYLYDCFPDDPDRHEGLAYYRDADNDLYGDSNFVCYICLSAAEEEPASVSVVPESPCEAGVQYVFNNLDCDDDDEEQREGVLWYRDADKDDLGDPDVSLAIRTCPEGPDDEPPEGYTNNALDCDDSSDRAAPATVYYFDDDGDSYGGPIPFISCSKVPDKGYVINTADCNDKDSNINPAIKYDCASGETIDVDNDCDGIANEDEGKTGYADDDGDGYGDSITGRVYCQPPEGWVLISGDCDDNDPNVFPGGAGC